MLGLALYANGQLDRAAAMFHEWAEEEPDNPIAQHMHAAYSGQSVPPRASDLYIEQTFNAFAASFDAQLGQLDYRAPELVADALARMCGTPLGALHGLDAGCGTGLCGPLIEPFLRRLVGVDLSAGMLDRARRRQVYDELVKAEVTDFLERHPAAYDVVVSTDMLVYFGPLEKVLRAAACALRPDGLLFFTVEEWTDPDRAGYRINPHGRYSHSRTHVAGALKAAGFALVEMQGAVLRQERGKPVAGLVVTAIRRGGV